MSYSIYLVLAAATLGSVDQSRDDTDQADADPAGLDEITSPCLERLRELVKQFQQRPVTPERTHCFEQQVQEELRELGRQTCQWTYNHAEPEPAALPPHVQFEALQYTRLNKKTPQNAWTVFGQIRLWRTGFRPTMKTGDATIFPLALGLGLVHGATPALAERAAGLMGDSGMTQDRVLERLRRDCGVGWGVKKLRQVTAAVAAAMAEQRHEVQVAKLLELLEQASASQGKHKPVLSVGRDGITMGVRIKGGSVFEVASTATITVFDRRGRRLGTVYLAYTPESGQKTMSAQLTRLLQDVFERWQGPLPRLAYVTDAGDNETTYYEKALSRMKHPRTGEKLEWLRVVDYYHASERVWKLAELLFDKGPRSAAWARKMQKWLLKPGGVNRVLHSAAAFRKLYKLKGKPLEAFRKAYRYLRDRMAYMNYAHYRSVGVPLGSGVTEAACKTVYTQRLKLSGMRWQKSGAQTILNLRVLQLSGVWDEAYARVLQQYEQPQVRGQAMPVGFRTRKAA